MLIAPTQTESTTEPLETEHKAVKTVGVILLALACLYLPGQAHAGQPRVWVAAVCLPALVFTLKRRPVWLWPWLALALSTGAAAIFDRAAIRPFLFQSIWVGSLGVGLALGPQIFAGQIPRIAALAGVLAVASERLFGGPFGNPSFLATFLMGTTLLTLTGRGPERWPSVAMQLVGLWWCHSLGAWAGLALGGLMLAPRPRSNWRKLGLAATVCLLALTQPTVQQHVTGRAHVSRVASRVALDSMPTGVGAGRLHSAFLDAQRDRSPEHWTNAYHAHNEVIHVVAEQGIPGGLLLVLPVLFALWRGRGAPRAVLAAMSVTACVSLPLYEPGAAFLTGLAVGVCLWRPATLPARSAQQTAPHTKTVLRWAVGLMALAAAVLATTELIADRLLYRGADTQDAELLQTAASMASQPAFALQQAALLELEAGRHEAARALAARALGHTQSVEGWMLLGRIHMGARDQRAAIVAFNNANRLHPRLFSAHFNLARAYEELGDRAAARRHGQRARSLRPEDPRLRWLPE